jgi:ABC-type uncharacterized transport system substrate-binding protein
MKRRVLIATVAAGAFMVSSRANAQGARKLPRVALVFNNAPVTDLAADMPARRLARAFVQGLRDQGLVEGRNITIERRSAEGRYERLPGLMRELLALPVDVIVAIGPALGAAMRATDTIPIVAVAADGLDDVGGHAASLARPGRNVTGQTAEIGWAVYGKRLQLLKEAVPNASRVAFLGQSSRPSDRLWHPDTESAAHALGLTLVWVGADTPGELPAAFAAIAKKRANTLCVDATAVNYSACHQPVRGATEPPRGLRFPGGPRGGGNDVLWLELRRPVPSRSHLRGQDPQGRQARRVADRATDEVRAGGQPEDRESTRPDDPARAAAAARRRGDRMSRIARSRAATVGQR